MKLSAKHPAARCADVFLDGEPLEACLAADETSGEALCFKIGEHGGYVEDELKRPVMETRRGHIEIRFHEGAPWSRDGETLYYLTGDYRLAVPPDAPFAPPKDSYCEVCETNLTEHHRLETAFREALEAVANLVQRLPSEARTRDDLVLKARLQRVRAGVSTELPYTSVDAPAERPAS